MTDPQLVFGLPRMKERLGGKIEGHVMHCFRFLGVIIAAILLSQDWGLVGIGRIVQADQPTVVFDVPAMLPMHELISANAVPVTPSKVVEVVIPVTTEIRADDREHVLEFRFDVAWSGHTFAVADYGPKSQTASPVDGTISVDQSDERNAGLGFNADSDVLEIATLSGKVDLSDRSATRKTYQEIPQHFPVVASGTVLRGTGAFFRFHRWRTETLEGGREVVVAYRVGRDWRGGILNVKCRAIGERKILGAFAEGIDVGKSFMVPVYLQGDVEATERATELVVAEQSLRRDWQHRRVSQARSGGEILLAGFNPFGNLGGREPKLFDHWIHRLIESGEWRRGEASRLKLPDSTVALAKTYTAARERLLELSH